MKIDFTRARLAAFSFVCGFIVCAGILSRSPTPGPQAFLTASVPMLAFTQAQKQSGPNIWVDSPQSNLPGLFHVESNPSLDQNPLLDPFQSLPGQGPTRNLDLIDMRNLSPIELPERP